MINQGSLEAFLKRLNDDLETAVDPIARTVQFIQQSYPHYHWVGIYWLRGDHLVLGPYVGASTEHTEIPLGKGVCGTAIVEGKNQIVADVRERANYLSCSHHVRSEIVVLLHDQSGTIIGQIDADSHELAAFDKTDEAMLERVALILERYQGST